VGACCELCGAVWVAGGAVEVSVEGSGATGADGSVEPDGSWLEVEGPVGATAVALELPEEP
jgi:hypothetical protein